MSDWKLRLLSFAPSRENGALVPAGLCLLLLPAAALQIALPAATEVPQGTGAIRAAAWQLPEVGEPLGLSEVTLPPLFTPTRLGSRLGEAVGDNADEETADAKPVVGPLGGAWVLGMERVGVRRAVIIRSAQGVVFKLPPGRAWRGWQLLSVQDNFALFRQGGKTHRINFGNAPPGAIGASDSENTSE